MIEVQVQGGGDAILASDEWLLSLISKRKEGSNGLRMERKKGSTLCWPSCPRAWDELFDRAIF